MCKTKRKSRQLPNARLRARRASLRRDNHPDGSYSRSGGTIKDTRRWRPVYKAIVPERRETTTRLVSVGQINLNEAVDEAWHVHTLCHQLVAAKALLKGREGPMEALFQGNGAPRSPIEHSGPHFCRKGCQEKMSRECNSHQFLFIDQYFHISPICA